MQRSEIGFVKGDILRKEMLEEIYSYPRMVTESYFAEYSDGILYGLSCMEKADGTIHIMPGALKLKGEIYFLEKEINLSEALMQAFRATLQNEQHYGVYFVESEATRITNSYVVYPLELQLVRSKDYSVADKNGFFFTRVYYSNGRFRIKADKNRLFGLEAANDGYGYKLPYATVAERIQKKLEEKANKCFVEYMILKELLERKGISVGLVRLYLMEKKAEYTCGDLDDPSKCMELLVGLCENGRKTDRPGNNRRSSTSSGFDGGSL